MDKSYILAALESHNLPQSLRSFGEDEFPFNIRTDRDIFLARLRRKDFQTIFRQNTDLLVPPVLCDDKEIMMEVVQRQPLVIRTMPDNWRDDKDIIRCVIGHPNMPTDVLEYLSEEIRADAELMIEVFQHPKSELSWIEYCSESLRDNKQFLTSVIEKFYIAHKDEKEILFHNYEDRNQILRYASDRLQNDFEFVMTCVRQSGLNLEFAGDELRQNEAIVVAACLQNGAAIQFCTLATIEQDLIDHKKFAESIVSRVSPEVLQMYLEKYGHDEDFSLASIWNKHLKWSMIAEQWRFNVGFAAKALLTDVFLWKKLPIEMKSNFEVASGVSKIEFLTRDILFDVIESCPQILADRDVLKKLLSNLYYERFFDELVEKILKISDIDFQNDKDIMLEVVKTHPSNVKLCSEQLRADEDIVSAAVEDFGGATAMLNRIHQMDHPNIVVRVLQSSFKDPTYFYCFVSPDLWQYRDVAMAWLACGGKWLDSYFPPQFIEDEELVLTAIKHHWDAFSEVPDALKDDKAFVLKALAMDARIIRDADDDLFFDEGMALEAISRDVRVIQFYVEDTDECFSFIVSLARKIRKRLQEYRTFQDEFIAAVTRSPKDTTMRPDCLLPMLNQGPVMMSTYENTIASYAGILLREGEELSRYESASIHLAQWGI